MRMCVMWARIVFTRMLKSSCKYRKLKGEMGINAETKSTGVFPLGIITQYIVFCQEKNAV